VRIIVVFFSAYMLPMLRFVGLRSGSGYSGLFLGGLDKLGQGTALSPRGALGV
jgi:hypothetical protein